MLQLIKENREGAVADSLLSLEAGLVLTGAEAKSVKGKHVRLEGSYIKFLDGEPYLVGLKISHYPPSGRPFSDESRARKVLLKKREIEKVFGLLSRKGLVCAPMEVYVKDGLVKVRLAVGRVLKKFEKKRKIVEAERNREQERELRE